MSADAVLLAASALHAGFQLVVTLLVYPALAATPADRWPAAHAAHTRRVTPVVGLVYGALLVAGAVTVAGGPGVPQVVAVAASGVAVAVTAAFAAPAHSRLAHGLDGRVLRRLLGADRVRLAAAVTAAVAALVGSLGT
jgi:hypothetical protein